VSSELPVGADMSLLFDGGGHEGGGSMLLGVSDISGGGQLVRTRCAATPRSLPPESWRSSACFPPVQREACMIVPLSHTPRTTRWCPRRW
jgi:hypothetical protein